MEPRAKTDLAEELLTKADLAEYRAGFRRALWWQTAVLLPAFVVFLLVV